MDSGLCIAASDEMGRDENDHGYKKKDSTAVAGDMERASEFNQFYNRFHSPSPAITSACSERPFKYVCSPPPPGCRQLVCPRML
ncbi:Uncharacterized protein DAT39_011667 [Clarias magur]|uniref:Uncharacterized protein n=1 Tax=Clarias magur TaxID=1594786 RepID=A0A8J4X2J8_CLAMG|nr:Uncharacterized protein DAT39_011667 [Clarias magur]